MSDLAQVSQACVTSACCLQQQELTIHLWGATKDNRQKPVILGESLDNSDQQLKGVLHMPGAGFLLGDL